MDEILDSLPNNKRERFAKLLDDNADLKTAVLNNPELAGSWNKLDDLGIADETIAVLSKLDETKRVQLNSALDNSVFTDIARDYPGVVNALVTDKGSRPDPRTYLDEAYIANHLSNFSDGGSRIVLKETYLTRGVGKPDPGKTEFVSTKAEIDEILQLPLDEQATKLGIPIEQIQGGGLVRIDFKPTDKIGIPSGNEFGANDLWIPGGKLPEGNLEAVVKTEGMQINVDYFVMEL